MNAFTLTAILCAVCLIFGAVAGGEAAAWHPAFNVGPCPFCLRFGPGYVAQLAEQRATLAQALATEKASYGQCSAALSAQNASVAALSAAGSKAQAQAETAVSAYAAASARASSVGAKLKAALAASKGNPVCQRYEAIDAAVVGALR